MNSLKSRFIASRFPPFEIFASNSNFDTFKHQSACQDDHRENQCCQTFFKERRCPLTFGRYHEKHSMGGTYHNIAYKDTLPQMRLLLFVRRNLNISRRRSIHHFKGYIVDNIGLTLCFNFLRNTNHQNGMATLHTNTIFLILFMPWTYLDTSCFMPTKEGRSFMNRNEIEIISPKIG